jgi:hypothetical protein
MGILAAKEGLARDQGATISKFFVASLCAVGALAACSATGRTPPEHRFELVSSAMALNADGSVNEDRFERCLYGRYAPGVAVHLLSDTDSTTCPVVTGRVGVHFVRGECTILQGIERCKGPYTLAVLGFQGAYRRLAPRRVEDGATLEMLGQAMAKGRVVEAASIRWRDLLERLPPDADIVDAVSWPELGDGPTLVRLRVKGDGIGGPWVAISRGEVGTIVGPFSLQAPSAFILDRRAHLSFAVAVCTNCGGVGTEVHAVEAGRLRRVLESFANAN